MRKPGKIFKSIYRSENKLIIVGITHLSPGNDDIPVERLVIERAVSINTAAAGGNASLMTMDNL